MQPYFNDKFKHMWQIFNFVNYFCYTIDGWMDGWMDNNEYLIVGYLQRVTLRLTTNIDVDDF